MTAPKKTTQPYNRPSLVLGLNPPLPQKESKEDPPITWGPSLSGIFRPEEESLFHLNTPTERECAMDRFFEQRKSSHRMWSLEKKGSVENVLPLNLEVPFKWY